MEKNFTKKTSSIKAIEKVRVVYLSIFDKFKLSNTFWGYRLLFEMERNQEKNEKILTKIFNLSLNFILISFLIAIWIQWMF